MAPTRIADVIVPSVFNPYVSLRTTQLSELYTSGIISSNPELDRLASSGGKTLNMPYWNDLTGASEILSDTAALTPQNITTSQDVAVLHLRGKAWAANDLAAALAGDDPMGEIADKVAGFWARDMQTTLLNELTGVFAAASMAVNVHDVSATVGAEGSIKASTFIAAVQKLGDAKDNVTAIMMHSAVEAWLASQDLIDYNTESSGSVRVRTYMGHRVIVDDSLTPSGGNYTSYIFGQGAIGYGNGAPPVPTETDRDSLAGDDILINRKHFILHPRGIKWQGTPAGAAPTNAELATGTNWLRVYDQKLIRIVKFVHKITGA